ncbi:MAG: hypothetical protein WC712_03270, partial [Candidatus Brocadiia bacterium]
LAPSKDGRFEDISDLPVEPEEERVFVSVINGKERFMLRPRRRTHGPLKGVLKRNKSRCLVKWTINFEANHNEWHLEGNLDDVGQFQSSGHSAEINMEGLFADWARDHLSDQGRWDETCRRFLVPFGVLSPTEQDGFKKSYSVPRVRAGTFGEFEKVIITDVPIGPKNVADATKWANARLERRLAEAKQSAIYRSRNDVRRLFVELTESTPLEAVLPVLPSHDDIVERYRASPGVYWSLAAGVDLVPVEPTPEELSALTIGQIPPAGQPRANTIRVPYRGGWSMAVLAARLLDGTIPRRVLLCDRYVMTPAQRVSLELLCRALCSVHATVTVDVVTQTEGQDKSAIAAIEKIIGPNGKVRGYHEIFGSARRNHPHARYLLVLPVDPTEQVFGWQMDNSPLDGCAEIGTPATCNTALRWRDFSAVRLHVDETPADLARWFTGGSL